MNTTASVIADVPLHPYYPLGVAIPAYVANSLSMQELLASFAAGAGAILLFTYYLVKSTQRPLTSGDIAATLWFVLCGCIHFFFEGYFARNFLTMAGESDLFGQLWKEYSLSDSRYLTQDSFVVCMEAVTAFFWGPMSFACAYFIVVDHPLRHPFQLIISLGQFYGDVLYYGTCLFQHYLDGTFFCRPENFYFWAYFVLCNAFWIVIPFQLMWNSVVEMASTAAKVKEAKQISKKR
ncbi:hypothetical protein S40285_06001 [Stachybotrys chlorohalonatus IBT 40285]|uniref:EXPERA domain-containing protein n=1 Tax=Stachybotrys chlorohalonatus (strain IBT 40285) TaxID=1283841 RepID=A0A084R0M9_STAC4|nr:hypothetical protein S40285_06001 [Stachybotrys chlorohalonata IBT 40285]